MYNHHLAKQTATIGQNLSWVVTIEICSGKHSVPGQSSYFELRTWGMITISRNRLEHDSQRFVNWYTQLAPISYTWPCELLPPLDVIGIKICRWALVQIYSQDVGVCCQSWGRQGRSFATNTIGEAINLHQCSVAGLNGYYSAFEW